MEETPVPVAHAQPRPLAYASPTPRTKPRWRGQRYWLIGPAGGAMVGAINVATATAAWVQLGQPDVYFRGWKGVRFTAAAWALGGALVGAPFAVAVRLGEQVTCRRVRVLPLLLSMALIAAAISAPLAYLQIRDRQLWALLWTEVAEFGACCVASILCSRRAPVRPA